MKTIQELEKMTDEELQDFLYDFEPAKKWPCNILRDLNACHAVEMNLSDEQGNAYINTIADSIDPMGEMGWKLDLAVCRATARQRTMALILTLQA